MNDADQARYAALEQYYQLTAWGVDPDVWQLVEDLVDALASGDTKAQQRAANHAAHMAYDDWEQQHARDV